MTCETLKPLLSEWTDETLDVPTAWQVQTHLAECADCRTASRELLSLRRALQSLPQRQPSAQFDAKLAERLALTRRPQQKPSGRGPLARLFSRPSLRPALRPALAFGFAATAVAAIILAPQPLVTPTQPAAVHTMDRSFVADCVAQHRREAGAEPLADLAAQNLAGRLDTPAGSASAPETSADQTAAADAGMF